MNAPGPGWLLAAFLVRRCIILVITDLNLGGTSLQLLGSSRELGLYISSAGAVPPMGVSHHQEG